MCLEALEKKNNLSKWEGKVRTTTFELALKSEQNIHRSEEKNMSKRRYYAKSWR